MKIRIKSETVIKETRKDNQGGTFDTFHQEALLCGDEEIKKFRLRVESESKGYAVGEYTLGSESITVNKYGALELARPVLVPVRSLASVVNK
jgi:hypothetical protein